MSRVTAAGPARKWLPALLAGLLLLPLSGCWDNKDVNHRALPIVMGIGKAETGYHVYLQVPEVTKKGLVTRMVNGTGPTVSEVIDRLSNNLENEVDLLHLKLIMFDRSYAETGLKDSITAFVRARDISPKTMIAISRDPIGRFFEEYEMAVKRNQMLLYDYFEKNADWNPEIAQTTVWQMFRSINSFTRDVAVPILGIGTSTPIDITGAAIIRNGRMVDRIAPSEALLVNIFNGRGAHGKIEVMNHATVLVLSNRMTHKSYIRGNRAVLNSTISIKVSLMETKGSPSADQIEQELEQVLEARFAKLLTKVKKQGADILGIGQLFRTKIPREKLAGWRDNYLPFMEVNVNVKATVQNEGNLK